MCYGRGREEHPPTGIKGKLVINDNLPPTALTRNDTLIVYNHANSKSWKLHTVGICEIKQRHRHLLRFSNIQKADTFKDC